MSTEQEIRLAMSARPWLYNLSRIFSLGVQNAYWTLGIPREVQVMATHRAVHWCARETNGAFNEQELLRSFPHAETSMAFEHGLFGQQLLYIRQSAVVAAWASLEALSEDLWVAALNNAGPNLRKRAFRAAAQAEQVGDSIPGLGQRQVELNLLAKYDFDLRSCLGTLLRKKFSFKTVDGIMGAYSVALEVPSLFENPKELKRVEASRHVIVHRAGVIDEEGADRLSLPSELVGTPLPVSYKDGARIAEQVDREGSRMFELVALKLQELDPVDVPEDLARKGRRAPRLDLDLQLDDPHR